MMVKYCVASGCNQLQMRGNGIQFHTFPFSRPAVLKKWVLAIGRENWKPTMSSTLCSKHFTDDSYQLRPGVKVRLLKHDAVPSVFNSTPSVKSQCKVKCRYCADKYRKEHELPATTEVKEKPWWWEMESDVNPSMVDPHSMDGSLKTEIWFETESKNSADVYQKEHQLSIKEVEESSWREMEQVDIKPSVVDPCALNGNLKTEIKFKMESKNSADIHQKEHELPVKIEVKEEPCWEEMEQIDVKPCVMYPHTLDGNLKTGIRCEMEYKNYADRYQKEHELPIKTEVKKEPCWQEVELGDVKPFIVDPCALNGNLKTEIKDDTSWIDTKAECVVRAE